MANYTDLINSVKAVIKTNGDYEITGAVLQAVLIGIIRGLSAGYEGDMSADIQRLHDELSGELADAVAAIQPIVIEGDVVNAPDEEDLTSENQGGTDVLKFKDKSYAPLLNSGLGRIFLRKNILNGKNVLTQDMINNANTIYHIQYDYDINKDDSLHNVNFDYMNTTTIDGVDYYYAAITIEAGEKLVLVDTEKCVLLADLETVLNQNYVIATETTTVYVATSNHSYGSYLDVYRIDNIITIPENCILCFDGGSLKNGTVIGSGTFIDASLVKIFDTSIIIDGNWNIPESYPEWFGVVKALNSSGLTTLPDCSQCLSLSMRLSKRVVVSPGYYHLDELSISYDGTIIGSSPDDTVFLVDTGVSISYSMQLTIENVTFLGGDFCADVISIANRVFCLNMKNMNIWGKSGVTEHGIIIDGDNSAYYITIANCRFTWCNYGVSFTHNSNACTIKDSVFENCQICTLIHSCNGVRLIGNTYQTFHDRAVVLDYLSGEGSVTRGNLILGNYFEGDRAVSDSEIKTAVGDIDISNNINCQGNFIVGNAFSLMISGSTKYPHIMNTTYQQDSKTYNIYNLVLDSNNSTYSEPSISLSPGFTRLQVMPKEWFNDFVGVQYLGCIAAAEDANGVIDFYVGAKDATHPQSWRRVIVANYDGNRVSIPETIDAGNICQYDNHTIQLGYTSPYGTPSERNLCTDRYNKRAIFAFGSVWRYLGFVQSGVSTNRPTNVIVGDCYFDATLGKPIWVKSVGGNTIEWVDANGDSVNA